MNLVGKW